MTTATKLESTSRQPVNVFGFFVLALLNIGVGHYWPGSMAATIVQYVFLGWGAIWIASRCRAGYLRRKPYWTRDSWLRYARLAAMPVIAVILVLVFSSFDMSANANVFGAPRSSTRSVWAVALLGLLFTGVAGVIVAMDWLAKGEPSEQFTRTRWFQRSKG